MILTFLTKHLVLNSSARLSKDERLSYEKVIAVLLCLESIVIPVEYTRVDIISIEKVIP